MGFLLTVAIVVGVPALALGLFRGVSPELARGEWPESWRTLTPARIWQFGGIIALITLLFAAASGNPRESAFLLFLAALIVVAFFLWAWQREFLFLMGLRDDAFPGQYDKLIWAFLLIMMAPVGLWFFRAYRLAHWPEPKPEMARSHTVSDLF
ncbi:hypothetical protein [Singulisphaera acidiphila]|uniref:Uncharacterized protein n=1 Tax=Singulisphaera acidiphila (strain ATCC BAA-1392 / DSM 18658 / VKM B-2454 / MOB10) TaxID=886293 RepID=L0DFK8_SINAD|nr:hypothetical protein [Singulisphaera acidiphila]AGA28047.1 hypothetical protein Sinac_3814 [Singulisphaera acidiphila DSM 18658]